MSNENQNLQMSGANLNLILQILNLAIKHGAPIVKSYIKSTNKEVITQEDIDDLRIDDNPDNWWDGD